jgi:FkbM family methyltransferase
MKCVDNDFIRPEHQQADLNVFREVWANDCYHMRSVPITLPPSPVIVDIGCHVGNFIRLARSLYTPKKLHGFDVIPANTDHATKQFLDEPMIACFGFGVTGKGETMRLHSSFFEGTGATGGSTLSKETNVNIHLYKDAGDVETVSIEDVWEDAGGSVHLLKLDCEGSEFGILENLPENADGTEPVIVGEWHGKERFMALIQNHPRLSTWKLTVWHDADIGLFRLEPPQKED